MKKLISILSITIAILIVATGIVKGTDVTPTGDVSLKIENGNNVNKGQRFTLIISGTTNDQLNGLSSKINFESSVLSIVERSALTNWNDMSDEQENEIVIMVKGTGINQSDMYKIVFEVKENTTATTTRISLTENTLSLASKDVSLGTKAIDVNIKEKQEGSGSQGSGEQGENGNGSQGSGEQGGNSNGSQGSGEQGGNSNGSQGNGEQGEDSNGSQGSEQQDKDDTTYKGKIAKTGVSYGIVIALAICVIGVFVSYRIFMKYKEI